MTRLVLWSDEALEAASTYLVDDRPGIIAVFDAVDLLADNPNPAASFAWGPGLRRLRVGRYRVIYDTADNTATIEVIRLGRSATPR